MASNIGACVSGTGLSSDDAAAAVGEDEKAAMLNTYLIAAQESNAGITDADVTVTGVVGTPGCSNKRRRLASGGGDVTLTNTGGVAKAQVLGLLGNSGASTFDSSGFSLLGQPFEVTGSDAVLQAPEGA